MKFLIFADLHTFLKENIRKITEEFDLIIFLGDINSVDIRYILNTFPDKPAYGVLGNHDTKDLFAITNNFLERERKIMQQPLLYPIEDINLKKVEIDNISFTGLEGAVKYRPTSVGYTQEEAFSLILPEADILFSHETGYHYISKKESMSHEGYKVISEYIKEKRPKYHIFGHHHTDIAFRKKKTKCYGVYGCSIFDSNEEKLKKIF